MRILHTADWHLGKSLHRRNRDAEHAAALVALQNLIASYTPDVLLVAGDVFDTATPPPEAERQLNQFLTDVAGRGVQTVMIAGNHDHPGKLRALRPLARLANVHVVDRPCGPADGGLVELRVHGEKLVIACVPWVTDRHMPSALEPQIRERVAMWRTEALAGVAEKLKRKRRSKAVTAAAVAEAESRLPGPDDPIPFAERARALLAVLAGTGFADDSVNVVMGHLFFDGGQPTGSEHKPALDTRLRLSASDLPAGTHYVALGHIHRPQAIDAPCPARYAGSLLQLSFNEERQPKSVVLLEAEPGTGVVDLQTVPLIAGRPLRTVEGSLDRLRRMADEPDLADAWLRVRVEVDERRPGLADEVRALLPNAVQVELAEPDRSRLAAPPELVAAPPRATQDLQALYTDFYAEVRDAELPDRLAIAFRELLEEETGATLPAAAGPAPAPAVEPEDAEPVAIDDESDDDRRVPHTGSGLFDGLEAAG